ncbi:hypothetical protein [Nocardia higoensis]|uniref:hypothetical protein n=1 Tax=Nocardia higoensis TaxID=228599 RepID=UPI0002DF16D3|nr:hypothetical protein [Nocardia higoensis]
MPTQTRATSDDKPVPAPRAKTPDQSADAPAAGHTPAAMLNLPFFRAEVAIPGPGVKVKAGPINLSLPTRYLYYGGLGALTVAGAVEWPIAGALAATGLVVDRIRKPASVRREAVESKAVEGKAVESKAEPTPAHS